MSFFPRRKCTQREIAKVVVDQKKKTKRHFTPDDLRGLAQMLLCAIEFLSIWKIVYMGPESMLIAIPTPK